MQAGQFVLGAGTAAELAGTIAYELLTRVGARMPRAVVG
jgi:alanine racemase